MLNEEEKELGVFLRALVQDRIAKLEIQIPVAIGEEKGAEWTKEKRLLTEYLKGLNG